MTTPKPPPAEKFSTRRYRRLLTYLKPAKWPFVGGLLAALLYAITSGLAFPVIIQVVVPVLFGKTKAPTEAVQTGSGNPSQPAALVTSSNGVASAVVTNGPASSGAATPESLLDEKTRAAQERLEKWAR